MFIFSIHLWNFRKISILLASCGSFNVKFWISPASLQNKNTWIGPFPWKWSTLQNPDWERRLGLPYNKKSLSIIIIILSTWLEFLKARLVLTSINYHRTEFQRKMTSTYIVFFLLGIHSINTGKIKKKKRNQCTIHWVKSFWPEIHFDLQHKHTLECSKKINEYKETLKLNKHNEPLTTIFCKNLLSFLSISSHRLTSLTNFRWKAFTSGFN